MQGTTLTQMGKSPYGVPKQQTNKSDPRVHVGIVYDFFLGEIALWAAQRSSEWNKVDDLLHMVGMSWNA